MPSPILVSHPSPSLSLLAIFRGFQLGIFGVFRGLQNELSSTTIGKSVRVTKTILKHTLIVQGLIWIIIGGLRISVNATEKITGISFDRYNNTFYLIINQIINLNFLLIVFTNIIINHQISDSLIIRLLGFFNQEFSTNFRRLERQQLRTSTHGISSGYKMVKTILLIFTGTDQRSFNHDGLINCLSYLKKYLSLITFNSFVCCIPIVVNETIGTFIIGLLVFQNLIRVTDMWSAIFTTFILSKLPFNYSVSLVLCFAECNVYMYDLLSPFFMRVKFTNSERRNWIRSREGVLFGFTLCFYFFILRFPILGVILIRLSEISLGYLLTKLSEIPPSNSSQLIAWSSTQIIWNKEKELEVLNGVFIEKN